jgi:hypothetical protein
MRDFFASRGPALALAAVLATGCHDQTLSAILPAPDEVIVGADDAGGDVRAADDEASVADAGLRDSGRGASKVSLVVHDTAPDRVALWSVQRDFEIGVNGVYPWGDWPKTYIASMDPAAAVLLGKDYIAVASESKQYTGGPEATVTLDAPADLYMLFDDRWMMPAWIAGWTDTGWNMLVWESINRPSLPFHVLMRSVPAGALDLPLIGDNIGYNYVIVVN